MTNKFGTWIPCSERLPEKDTWCLVTTYNESTGKWFVEEANYDSKGVWCDYLDDYIVVSAWMPLPEPYKEDVDE